MTGRAFDLTGPLPRCTTLLEASAGTGKTYAIAALATRYLAERDDLDTEHLLLITFGRHATGQLRSRVFDRLTSTVAALDEVIAGRPLPDPSDTVAAHLAAHDARRHRDRLSLALTRFNELTILTTHAFCQALLRELGILGDWDPAEDVGPDPADLVRQCGTDAYLRLNRTDPEPAVPPKGALRIGHAACTTTLPLLPAEGPHRQFAEAARELYEQRKIARRVCTYNDIVARLARLLRAKGSGDAVASELRRMFPVVLIDEFQDTDPDQWEVVERAFVAPDRATILIGDPKQSIYAFRGADLSSYLAAKRGADVHTLEINWRSDAPLVDAVHELFQGVELGDPSVVVGPITAAHPRARLHVPTPQRLWVRTGAEAGLGNQSTEKAIDADLVSTLRNLITQSRFAPGADGDRVRYSDIAILVRRSARARQLRRTLDDAGIPAVVTGSQSVWAQPAARDWAILLRAMADPTQSTVKLAAMTMLIGSDLGELLDPEGSESARVGTLVRELGRAFAEGGVGRVVTHLRTVEDLDARVLAEPDGERDLADVLHIAELLEADGGKTPSTLLDLLEERSRDADEGDALRVATNDDAVRIMTIHAAKGLEFPVVLLPETGGVKARPRQPFTIIEDGRRHLYIGPPPGYRDALAKDLVSQSLAEELRLLYVALTRAVNFCVAWHVDTGGAPGPMGTLLAAHSRRLAASGGGTSGVFRSEMGAMAPPTVPPAPAGPVSLPLATLDRDVDQTWRRTSYSGLTHALHDQPPAYILSDEPAEVDVAVPAPSDPALAVPSPMNGLPAGAGFGTLVHEALESIEWQAETLEASAEALAARLGPQHALPSGDVAPLTQALVSVCRTPLIPLTDRALTDIPTSRRLAELDFDLPLADRGNPATLDSLAGLMSTHLPPTDPLAAYPGRLRASEAAGQVLNGFLTGSIDAVLQLDDGRFVVVDYKTNRLGPPGGADLTLGHYVAPAMVEAMMQAHYPLQALLYCVALHRHLTVRLPDYDPARHLGGVGYLFVRGMAGRDTPVVDGSACGVLAWYPPAALVVDASELLGGTHA